MMQEIFSAMKETSSGKSKRLLGLAVERILDLKLFPIVLGGGHETTFGHFQEHCSDLKKKKEALGYAES